MPSPKLGEKWTLMWLDETSQATSSHSGKNKEKEISCNDHNTPNHADNSEEEDDPQLSTEPQWSVRAGIVLKMTI